MEVCYQGENNLWLVWVKLNFFFLLFIDTIFFAIVSREYRIEGPKKPDISPNWNKVFFHRPILILNMAISRVRVRGEEGGSNSFNQSTNKWSNDAQNYEKRLYHHIVLTGTNIIGCFHQKVRDSNAMILSAMFRQVIFRRYMCVEDSINEIVIFVAHKNWIKNKNLYIILFVIIVVQTALSTSVLHCCMRLQWDCNRVYIDNRFDVLY